MHGNVHTHIYNYILSIKELFGHLANIYCYVFKSYLINILIYILVNCICLGGCRLLRSIISCLANVAAYCAKIKALQICAQNSINRFCWKIICFLCVYQVLIRGQFYADSEASEVLAIDDLSFSPGCMTASGTALINNIHRRTCWDLDVLKYRCTWTACHKLVVNTDNGRWH